jgi:hypothetical protein
MSAARPLMNQKLVQSFYVLNANEIEWRLVCSTYREMLKRECRKSSGI